MRSALRQLCAFLLGMREFRLGFTTHFNRLSDANAYSQGRALAHRMSLRRFSP